MALDSKKSAAIHTKTGGDLLSLKEKFDNGDHASLANYPGEAALMYQMQLMQNDIEELRRYLTSEVGNGATGSRGPSGARGTTGPAGSAGGTGARGAAGADGTTPTMTSLSGSSLPTRKPASGLLWNDRGIVKIG